MNGNPVATDRLILTGNTWSLLQYPSPDKEWETEEKCAFFAEAGFEAVTLPGDPQTTPPILERHGLRFCGFFAATKTAEIRDACRQQVDAGAETINCFLGTPDTSLKAGTEMLEELLQLENETGVPAHVETHRATMTEDPRFTHALILQIHELTGLWPRICWDPSHLAVVKHLSLPEVTSALDAFPSEHWSRCDQLHLRPFNGQHAQVPVIDGSNGHETAEFQSWSTFALDLLKRWNHHHPACDPLWVVPELGPVAHGYRLSTFPDISRELLHCARRMRQWAAEALP